MNPCAGVSLAADEGGAHRIQSVEVHDFHMLAVQAARTTILRHLLRRRFWPRA